MWEHLSAADVVRRIYHHLAIGRLDLSAYRRPSSTRSASLLPIAAMVAVFRGRRTQGLWRSGHIRNLVVNPVYRGVLQYGRRSSRGRTVVR